MIANWQLRLLKDTHDLFATLIVSLELTTHRSLFKTYPNSFTTDEAVENLAALKFSQSNRVPDPSEPNRVITTTTTTTFTMNREMAKGICQHFMDAHLIENAQDTSGTIFKDKGIWLLTPKGLHILERFITKNGINGEHLLQVFSTQPICMKLLHLERRSHDDELLVNHVVLEVIFRRFIGRQPNYPSKMAMFNGTPNLPRKGNSNSLDRSDASSTASGPETLGPGSGGPDADFDRTLGVEMMDVAERARNGQLRVIKHTFSAMTALEWLVDYTTLAGKDEAADVCAHFERLDLVELIADKPRTGKEAQKQDSNIVFVRGEDGGGMVTEGEFRCYPKAIYGITDKGRETARWDGYWKPPPAPTSHDSRPASTTGGTPADSDLRSLGDREETRSIPSDSMRHGIPRPDSASDTHSTQPTSANASRSDLHDATGVSMSRDSNTTRLRQILEEPALRSLFREFLKRNFCEENLSFWLDVQDFKRRFHTTSSAVAVRPSQQEKPKSESMATKMASKLRGNSEREQEEKLHASSTGFSAMEKHQQDLIAMAFVIYNTYLAPASPCELNIEHNLRTELVSYVTRIVSEARGTSGSDVAADPHLNRTAADLGLPSEQPAHGGKAVPNSSLEDRKTLSALTMPKIPIHASQLQTLVRLYQRIQDPIFRLMATDSVPRFIKDARFLSLVKSVEDYSRALEAGRIDPVLHSGPAVARDVLDAMDLGNLRDALPH